MHTNNYSIVFKMLLISINLFHPSKSNTPWISSEEKDQFVSTKDINAPFTNVASLQSVEFSNPTTQNIAGRSENRITQNLAKEDIILKRSQKKGANISKGNSNLILVLNSKLSIKNQIVIVSKWCFKSNVFMSRSVQYETKE